MTLQLRVISGLQIGDQLRVEPPGAFIGRGEGCALHLRDESVSRSHVELRFQQDVVWAHPHSSRGLTLLDGVPLGNSPQALRDHGVLQVGNVRIEYTHERSRGAVARPELPPTMINIHRELPTIQHAILPQLTPLREAYPSDTPATLILHRPLGPLPPFPAVPKPPAPASSLSAQALRLLTPFGDSLEQASLALQQGDTSRARALLREASFGLGDLRDLFEAAPS